MFTNSVQDVRWQHTRHLTHGQTGLGFLQCGRRVNIGSYVKGTLNTSKSQRKTFCSKVFCNYFFFSVDVTVFFLFRSHQKNIKYLKKIWSFRFTKSSTPTQLHSQEMFLSVIIRWRLGKTISVWSHSKNLKQKNRHFILQKFSLWILQMFM